MKAPGLYLLAVVRGGAEPGELRIDFDVPLAARPVRQGALAALAAPTDCQDWMFDRGAVFASHVKAHQDALRRLGEPRACVPFPYGTVAESESAVRALLATRSGLFESLLLQLDAADAFEVGVRFEPEHVLRAVAAGDPGFITVLRQAAGAGAEAEAARATMQDRIGGWLRREGSRLAARCLGTLAPVARDLRERPRRAAESALEAVFLVPRTDRGPFDRAVDDLAGGLPRGVVVSCVGPLPPIAFADARLQPVDREAVDRARRLLELPERATRKEIHAAYLRLAAAAHPDAGGTIDRFREVDGAYRLLSAYLAAAGGGDDALRPLAAAAVPLVFVLVEGAASGGPVRAGCAAGDRP